MKKKVSQRIVELEQYLEEYKDYDNGQYYEGEYAAKKEELTFLRSLLECELPVPSLN